MIHGKLTRSLGFLLAVAAGMTPVVTTAQSAVVEYSVPPGSGPHDVAPAGDGRVWFTAQRGGNLGWLNPKDGSTRLVSLGERSRPHGVIIGPDGAPWVTDGGLNAIVRVDPTTLALTVCPLPDSASGADLNSAAFDGSGTLWFTGEAGYYGRLWPASRRVEAFNAPEGPSPYGISSCTDGMVYFVSLAASYLGRIDTKSAQVSIVRPPSPRQGTRRVSGDADGRLWITGWDSGNLLSYDTRTKGWHVFRLPGARPKPYAVYVDERGQVWLSDLAANAILRFDPPSERFTSFPLPTPNATVRELLGRPGEVWGAESATDKLVVIRE
jgi:virginiamycin B lyase